MVTNRTTVRRVPASAVRKQLEKIARSEPFARSRRLVRFLRLVVESKLARKSSILKEYVIGVNVFDRRESFDPRLDPIVRVEAGRLRAKLREYYDTEGLADPVRIALPKRTYVPEIEFAPETSHERDRAPSIAVLPFVDLSPRRDQEYLCDGISETILDALVKLKGLRVVARTSSFRYKGKPVDVRDLGRELGADLILGGSVRKAGTRIRVAARLSSVANGYHLWSETLDRQYGRTFAAQDEISAVVVRLVKKTVADRRTW
jgi:TolB-like protein